MPANITNIFLVLCIGFMIVVAFPVLCRIMLQPHSIDMFQSGRNSIVPPLEWSARRTKGSRCESPQILCDTSFPPLTSQIESYRVHVLEKLANRTARNSRFYEKCAAFHHQPEDTQIEQLLSSPFGNAVRESLRNVTVWEDVETAIYGLTKMGLPVYFRYGHPDIGLRDIATLELAELPEHTQASERIAGLLGYRRVDLQEFTTHTSEPVLYSVDTNEVEQFVSLSRLGYPAKVVYTQSNWLEEYKYRLHTIPVHKWKNYLIESASRWLAFRFHIGEPSHVCISQYQHLHPLTHCRALKPQYVIGTERIDVIFARVKHTYIQYLRMDPYSLGGKLTKDILAKIETLYFVHSRCWMSQHNETQPLLTQLEQTLSSGASEADKSYLSLVSWVWQTDMRLFRTNYGNRLYKDLVATFIAWNGAYDSNSNVMIMTPGLYHYLAHRMRESCELASFLSYHFAHEMTHLVQRVAQKQLPYLRARSPSEIPPPALATEAGAEWHGVYVAYAAVHGLQNDTRTSHCFFDTCLLLWCGRGGGDSRHPTHSQRFQIILHSLHDAYKKLHCGL